MFVTLVAGEGAQRGMAFDGISWKYWVWIWAQKLKNLGICAKRGPKNHKAQIR